MRRQTPRSTRTATLVPYTTLFRSSTARTIAPPPACPPAPAVPTRRLRHAPVRPSPPLYRAFPARVQASRSSAPAPPPPRPAPAHRPGRAAVSPHPAEEIGRAHV